MDKIREEFEKKFGIQTAVYYTESNTYQDDEFENIWNGYTEGYKSRDKEIEKLKAFGKIDKQRIEEGLAEIKRLNKLIDSMLSTMVEFGIEQTEANQKALRGGGKDE